MPSYSQIIAHRKARWLMIPQRDWLAIDNDPVNWFGDVPDEARLVNWVTARDKDHAKWLAERLRRVCG